MPTFGQWEHTVLEHSYDDVDYISCHVYYEEVGGDTASFLASAVNMDHFIESVVATADAVGAQLKSAKKVNISFDEWNVWYVSRYQNVDRITDLETWPIAPRLLEDSYSVVDAVVVGNLLISLINHADRVTAASLAQLVNVIAPIMTEPGGAAWRQTTFFPFAITSRLATGTALKLQLDSETYDTEKYGTVNVVDASATHDVESGNSAIFLVNRAMDEPTTVSIDVRQLGAIRIAETHTIADEDDIRAANTLDDQVRVQPFANESARIDDGILTITLPAVSWSAISLTALDLHESRPTE